MISGAAIPTQRAFVMTGIVFAAILLDRLRISMRICAIAAMVVLLLDPASLVGVSFQMSFGAVVALIAVYEQWGAQLAHLFHNGSFVRQVWGYGAAVAVTTVVATVGTEPFAIYHFHHLVLYSPLANVIAVPISAMWTLPWGVVACLLMPFGLEQLALTPMGWGIDVTIWVARWVAALPGNVWHMPRLPTLGAVLVALGGCWLCLWQQRWRVWGIPVVVAGLATMLFTRPPDIVLADFGRLLAARAPDGNYLVADGAEKLPRSFLAQETGAELLPWPAHGSQRRPARLQRRRTLPLYRARQEGGAGDRVVRAPGDLRYGRRDRRAGAGRVRLPRPGAGGRPHRQLAPRRGRAVAGAGRSGRRQRQRQPRRPALGTAPGIGAGARRSDCGEAAKTKGQADSTGLSRHACAPELGVKSRWGSRSIPGSVRGCRGRGRAGGARAAKRSRASVIASGRRSPPVGRYWIRLSRKPAPGHVIGVEAARPGDRGLRLGHRPHTLVGREIGPVGRQAAARRQRIDAAPPEGFVERRRAARIVKIDQDDVEPRRVAGQETLRRVDDDRLAQIEPAAGDRRDALVGFDQGRRAFRQIGAHEAPHRGAADPEQQRRDRRRLRTARRPATSAARSGTPAAPDTSRSMLDCSVTCGASGSAAPKDGPNEPKVR